MKTRTNEAPVGESDATKTARNLVKSMVEAGVEHVVYCPGSRSAPLAYALSAAQNRRWLQVHVRLDERGAGFFALGLARAGEMLAERAAPQPVAIVTTSGTAVANLHPAVLEAHHQGVPLLVISADRPHELRQSGASQTTEQVGIFGPAVREVFDIPAHDVGGKFVGDKVRRAVTSARGTLSRNPGPVQLNVAFREPLVPLSPWDCGPSPALAPVAPHLLWTGSDNEDTGQTTTHMLRETVVKQLVSVGREVVVAGDKAGPVAQEFAEKFGLPLLAEPTSNARYGRCALRDYQQALNILGDQVTRVWLFGHPTLSRPVTKLLANPEIEVIIAHRGGVWPDPAAGAKLVIPAHLAQVLAEKLGLRVGGGSKEWLSRWHVAAKNEQVVARNKNLTAHENGNPIGEASGEAAAEKIWAAHLTYGAPALLIGASSVIRAFDRASSPGPFAPRAFANRGLAGIDGTLATGLGLAAGSGHPVRVVVGDLTFIHDLGSLVRGLGESQVRVQIVVFDNAGGAIFGKLEHGSCGERGYCTANNSADDIETLGVEQPISTFDRFFRTSQNLDLEYFAKAVGATYSRLDVRGIQNFFEREIKGLEIVHLPLQG